MKTLNLILTMIFAIQSVSFAHLDPPGNPPVQTSIDVVNLTIHDAIERNFLGGENSALNDGGPVNLPSTNMAELMVVVDIDWGGDHGHSFWSWSGEYNFTTHVNTSSSRRRWNAIGRRAVAGRDYGIVMSFPLPGTQGPQANIASHMECSPIVQPTFNVRAFEIDKGDSWLGELATALIDDFVPGGATIGHVLNSGLQGLNGNDELTVDVGAPDGQDDSKKPEVEIEFRHSTVQFPEQDACNTQVAYLHEPVYQTPLAPETISQPPTEYVTTINDEYFQYLGQMYMAAGNPGSNAATASGRAKQSNNANIPDHYQWGYEMAARFGVDEWHPFGRNTKYANVRYDQLIDILKRVEKRTSSDSELKESDFLANQYHARGMILGVAYMVAAQVWSEAKVRLSLGSNVDVSKIDQATSLMNQAANEAVINDDYSSSIDLYRQAAVLLIQELYPAFNQKSSSNGGNNEFFGAMAFQSADGDDASSFQIVDGKKLACKTGNEVKQAVVNLDLSHRKGQSLNQVEILADTSNDPNKRPRVTLTVTDANTYRKWTVLDEFLPTGLSSSAAHTLCSFMKPEVNPGKYFYTLNVTYPENSSFSDNAVEGVKITLGN